MLFATYQSNVWMLSQSCYVQAWAPSFTVEMNFVQSSAKSHLLTICWNKSHWERIVEVVWDCRPAWWTPAVMPPITTASSFVRRGSSHYTVSTSIPIVFRFTRVMDAILGQILPWCWRELLSPCFWSSAVWYVFWTRLGWGKVRLVVCRV